MHAVLNNLDIRVELFTDEALYNLKTFLLALLRIASLIYTADIDSILTKYLLEVVNNSLLKMLYSECECLNDKHILILINYDSRQEIGFTEYHPA